MHATDCLVWVDSLRWCSCGGVGTWFAQVLMWKEGATVSDDRWAIPSYCFSNGPSPRPNSSPASAERTLNWYFRELKDAVD